MSKKYELSAATNLNSLVELVNESVISYAEQAPKYRDLSTKLLDKLSSEEMINVMDINAQMKMLEIANKNITQPLDQLTKLVQAVTSLADRQETNKAKESFDEMIDEVARAREKSKQARKLEALDIDDFDDDQDEIEIELD